MFTLNNYTSDDYDRLTQLVDNGECVYIIFGTEVGDSGTPHLQGFIAFDKRVYLTDVKNRISRTAHFELTRSVPKSIEHCRKDGDVYEGGIIPTGGQGKRTDIEDFQLDVKGGLLNLKEMREMHLMVYAIYRGFVTEYVNDNSPTVDIPSYPLHEWQEE